MAKYFMYPKEKLYQIISNSDALIVSQMKKKGLEVNLQSSAKPAGEYKEDNNLYNRMVEKLELINLTETIKLNVEPLLPNNKGLFLYKTQQGIYGVRGTDVLDKDTVQNINQEVEVLTIYPLPDSNVINSIAAQIFILNKKK